jgi:hypothetical protein
MNIHRLDSACFNCIYTNRQFSDLFSFLAPTCTYNYYFFTIYLIITLLLYFLSLNTLIFLLVHVGACSFYYFSFLRLDLA